MPEIERAEIARGVGELYEPLADDKGIHLKVEAPVAAPVHGNRELISQALANLVDNAIKYGAEMNGTDAEIVVTARGEGDRILLAVADSGSGIPAADRGRAVERFVRLRQSRSTAGSGVRRPPRAAGPNASCGSNRAAHSRVRAWVSASPRRWPACMAVTSS